MKKTIIFSFLFFVFSFQLAFAQTTSPTPTSAVRDAVAKKVAEELAAIKNNVVKRSFVGEVTAKSDTTMTLASLRKQPRTITLLPDTTLPDTTVKLAGKETSLADIKVGNFVISMGDVDSNGTMTAKRVLIIEKPTADSRRVISGIVTKVTSTQINIDTVKKESWTVKVTTDPKLIVEDKTMVIGKLTLGTNTLTALKIQKLTK